MIIKNQSHFYYPIIIFIKYTVNNNSRQQITIYIVRQIFEYSEYCKSSIFIKEKFNQKPKECMLRQRKRLDLQHYETLFCAVQLI